MKSPFRVQVAVVCLILVVGALCLPLPDGGIVMNRILGQKPFSSVRTLKPRPGVVDAPVVSAPVVTAPMAAVPLGAPPPADFLAGPSSRFASALDFAEDESRATDAWSAGLAAGKPAWRDNRSGMIWGERLDIGPLSYDAAGMARAEDACAQEEPRGSWALPTTAEFDIAKVNGILSVDAGAKHRWLSYLVVPGTDMKMPAGRGYVPVSQEKDFSVRCVARSEKAPAGGYLQADNETTLKAMQ